jgi:hypothetical protein
VGFSYTLGDLLRAAEQWSFLTHSENMLISFAHVWHRHRRAMTRRCSSSQSSTSTKSMQVDRRLSIAGACPCCSRVHHCTCVSQPLNLQSAGATAPRARNALTRHARARNALTWSELNTEARNNELVRLSTASRILRC